MLRLVPAPAHTDMADARTAIAPRYTAEALLSDAAATLADYARRTHGVTFTPGAGGITFSVDASLPAEGYILTVTADGATVTLLREKHLRYIRDPQNDPNVKVDWLNLKATGTDLSFPEPLELVFEPAQDAEVVLRSRRSGARVLTAQNGRAETVNLFVEFFNACLGNTHGSRVGYFDCSDLNSLKQMLNVLQHYFLKGVFADGLIEVASVIQSEVSTAITFVFIFLSSDGVNLCSTCQSVTAMWAFDQTAEDVLPVFCVTLYVVLADGLQFIKFFPGKVCFAVVLVISVFTA